MKHKILFLVGTGRSGSTLLQEILGRQKSVYFPNGEQLRLWFPNTYPYNDKLNLPNWLPTYQEDPDAYMIYSAMSLKIHQKLMIELFLLYVHIMSYFRPVLLKSPMLTLITPYLASRLKNSVFIFLRRPDEKTVQSWIKKDYDTKHRSRYSDVSEYEKILSRYVARIRAFESSEIPLSLEHEGRTLIVNHKDFIGDPKNILSKIQNFWGLSNEIIIPSDIVLEKNR